MIRMEILPVVSCPGRTFARKLTMVSSVFVISFRAAARAMVMVGKIGVMMILSNPIIRISAMKGNAITVQSGDRKFMVWKL